MTNKCTSEHPLKHVLTRKTLEEYAGNRSYERGLRYWEDGRVKSLVVGTADISAKVAGNYTYRVKLGVKGSKLSYSCSCPVGQEWSFCKHCVAVGLEWLERVESPQDEADASGASLVTIEGIERYLSSLERSDLIHIIKEEAEENEVFYKRLITQAVRSSGDEATVNDYKKVIDEITEVDNYFDYDSLERLEDFADSLEELFVKGRENDVIALAEYFLAALEDMSPLIDHHFFSIDDIAYKTLDLHFRACERVKPDPEKLAERLFKWEMHSNLEPLYGFSDRYLDLIGKKGMDAYRHLAQEVWEKVPVQKTSYDYSCFRITKIMENLAKSSGDLDSLIEIKCRDLSHPGTYLSIAELLSGAKRHDEAVEWAEKGLHAFPERPDSRLRLFLADNYHRMKRYDDELKMIWKNFTEHPGLDTYTTLKDRADQFGTWPEWREKALSHLRSKRTKKNKRERTMRFLDPRPDSSRLVEIFLWEGDIDSAWHEAQQGDCTAELWLRLAKTRSKKHPEDAVTIYKQHVERLIGRKNNQAYEEAVKYLHQIQKLMKRMDQSDAFHRYLESVKGEHKRKRNLMHNIDKGKWRP